MEGPGAMGGNGHVTGYGRCRGRCQADNASGSSRAPGGRSTPSSRRRCAPEACRSRAGFPRAPANGIRITISGVRIRRPLRFGRLPEVGGLFRGPVPVSGGGALEPLAPWLHGLPPVAASGPFALDAP